MFQSKQPAIEMVDCSGLTSSSRWSDLSCEWCQWQLGGAMAVIHGNLGRDKSFLFIYVWFTYFIFLFYMCFLLFVIYPKAYCRWVLFESSTALVLSTICSATIRSRSVWWICGGAESEASGISLYDIICISALQKDKHKNSLRFWRNLSCMSVNSCNPSYADSLYLIVHCLTRHHPVLPCYVSTCFMPVLCNEPPIKIFQIDVWIHDVLQRVGRSEFVSYRRCWMWSRPYGLCQERTNLQENCKEFRPQRSPKHATTFKSTTFSPPPKEIAGNNWWFCLQYDLDV